LISISRLVVISCNCATCIGMVGITEPSCPVQKKHSFQGVLDHLSPFGSIPCPPVITVVLGAIVLGAIVLGAIVLPPMVLALPLAGTEKLFFGT
jgi:hypothetical protein